MSSENNVFLDEIAAYRLVERVCWPDGPVCPHCGGTRRIGRLRGNSVRAGTYKCYDCRKPFNVRLGTLFENSNIPLCVWMQALYLLAARGTPRRRDLYPTLGLTERSTTALIRRLLAHVPPPPAEAEPIPGGNSTS